MEKINAKFCEDGSALDTHTCLAGMESGLKTLPRAPLSKTRWLLRSSKCTRPTTPTFSPRVHQSLLCSSIISPPLLGDSVLLNSILIANRPFIRLFLIRIWGMSGGGIYAVLWNAPIFSCDLEKWYGKSHKSWTFSILAIFDTSSSVKLFGGSLNPS